MKLKFTLFAMILCFSITAQNINRIEYFFDTDPGFGNGIAAPITPATTISNLSFNANIASLSKGFHQLYIRSCDDNGRWSITNRTFIYKMPNDISNAGISAIEYFFDTDPGFGNGIQLTSSSNNISGLTINTNVSSLSNGLHQLYIRSKDVNGNWGITNRSFFYKLGNSSALPNIVKLEYYYDTDPGFGNATNITITPNTNLTNIAFANDLCSLSPGLHKIYVRSLDANGNWSVTNSKSIDVQTGTFYADNDHDGYGNPSISITSCIAPQGYVVNNTDCNDNDSLQHPGQIWYTDIDHDHYGIGDSVIQCTRPLNKFAASELIAVRGDCDDNNAFVNPGAQHFSYSSSSDFISSLVSPLNGSSYTTFNFEAIYTDANGGLPPATFPRVVMDYEGNNSLVDPNDRVVIMSPFDVNDLNTMDGKRYIASITSLPVGANYLTSIQSTSNGCTTKLGPFNYPDVLQQPDIEIFANDITFSDPHPAVASPLTVSATIHNVSDYAAQNFIVHLRNQYDTTIVYPDILVTYLPPHGAYTVSWNITTPTAPAWCPMEVSIDYTNTIPETNELDNSAIRPFVNGNYNLPGGIHVNATINPAVGFAGYPTSVYGHAFYYGTAVPLLDSSVDGAIVNFTIIETGASFSTTTNSNGYFSYQFTNPSAPGIYHITGSITDFTLTGNFTTSFEVVASPVCNLPDLSTGIVATTSYGASSDMYQPLVIVQGDHITGNTTIKNNGNTVAGTSILNYVNVGSTPLLSNVSVPSLNTGNSFGNAFNVQYNTPGFYSLYAQADVNNNVNECNEDNTRAISVHVLPNLPDISPYSGPGGTFYNCSLTSLDFTLVNYGGSSTGAFVCTILKKFNGTVIGTETVNIPSIAAAINTSNNFYAFSIPFNAMSEGDYSFELKCDLPANVVNEYDELNNTALYSIHLIQCKPNFSFAACEHFDVVSSDGDYTTGSNITLNADLYNNGNLAYNGSLNIRYQLSGGTLINDSINVNLLPGASVPVSKIIAAPAPSTQVLSIIADPSDLIDELNEADNGISDNMCWDFYPDSSIACSHGDAFWEKTYTVNQALYAFVGVGSSHLYDADTLYVRFEVSGPGLSGTINLGNAVLYNVEKTCYCPVIAYLPTSFSFPQLGTYTFTMTVDPDHKYSECNELNNVLVRSVNVVNLPDMRELSQYIAPSSLNPQVGQPVSFNITYDNIGISNITNQMKLNVMVDNQLFSSINNVSGLIKDDNATISIPATWSSNLTGVHVIRAIIDADNSITESNELNNEATRAIVVGSAANLYFQVFTSLNLYPAINTVVNVKARVGNAGDLPCQGDMQLFYVNNNLDTILFLTQHVNLNAHDSVNFTIPWLAVDNKTTIIGKLINTTALEYTYDDNSSQFELGKMNVILNSLPACGANNQGTITASVVGGEAPYNFIWNNGVVGSVNTAPIGTYTVTVSDITGQTVTAISSVIPCPPVTLQLKLFIQGYYVSAGLMTPVLMNQGELFLSNDVDSIAVELHDTVSPFGMVASYSGILETNGTISCYFPASVNSKAYYIVVRHRNLITTWSAEPVLLSTITTYNFSDHAWKAYGNNEYEVESGIFAMYSGDITQDENIDLLDANLLENDINEFQFGYKASDINGDGNVDLLDSPLIDVNSNNFIFSMHP